MSAVALGLAGAGAGILAATLGRAFASGLFVLVMVAGALVVFLAGPPSFAAMLLAALTTFAAWAAMPGVLRSPVTLAAAGAGLLCAAVSPHVTVQAAGLPVEPETTVMSMRLAVALAALAIGAGLAGSGGAGLALLGCALGLGLLDPGSPVRWLFPPALVGALLLARRAGRGSIAALVAISMLTLWET